MSRMNKAPDPSALLAFATGAGESLSEMRAKKEEAARIEAGKEGTAVAETAAGETVGEGGGESTAQFQPQPQLDSSAAPSESQVEDERPAPVARRASASAQRGRRGRSRARKAKEVATEPGLETGRLPKIPKNFRIRQDLAERIEAIVAVSEMTQTDLLESALEAFLDEMEARYEERTGRQVPRATRVRLLD